AGLPTEEKPPLL
nr:RecName: Full=Unknown protein from spot 110 of 2D-PAGE of thylakoid [Pisum sativum]